MDETQIKQLISDTITSSLASATESIKTEVMSSVNSTLNGYEAKQKRLLNASNQVKPKTEDVTNAVSNEDEEANNRIAELERKLAEKEAQEIKSKKASAVNEYVSRHQASPDFGEYFLLKHESEISIEKDGSMKVGKQTLEEALEGFKEGKGSHFFQATVVTEEKEEGNLGSNSKTEETTGFNVDAFLSTFNV